VNSFEFLYESQKAKTRLLRLWDPSMRHVGTIPARVGETDRQTDENVDHGYYSALHIYIMLMCYGTKMLFIIFW